MQLTKAQLTLFFREWKSACIAQGWTRDNGWTAEQINQERYNLIREATGHDSLTAVDRNKDFTALLESMAVLKSDLNRLQHAEQNPRRQLIWRIRRSPEAYWQSICHDRFGTTDLDSLSDDQLTQLRNTLADRSVGQHRNSTRRIRNAKARTRRAAKANAPDPRIQFPDLADAPTLEESPEDFRRAEVTAGEVPNNNPF